MVKAWRVFDLRSVVRRCRRPRSLLIALLAIHAALLASSAAVHSPTIDEPAHVAAGISHWRFADFTLYRVNPPLVRLVATAPLLATSIATDWGQYTPGLAERREHGVGHDLVEANRSRIFFYVALARWACIPFSLIGAIVCYRWARVLFGARAGLLAATLWCFSPTVLGNAALLTPDAAGTALGLASGYAFFRWLVAPRFASSLWAGVALGAAEAAKSTWIILFGLYPAVWLLARWRSLPSAPRPPLLQLATILALAWWLLLGIYGWEAVGTPLGSLPVRSHMLRQAVCVPSEERQTPRIRPALAWIPIPSPRNYVIGLDQQWRDLEGPNRSFLRGEWRDFGWYHYYVYGLAVKEPLGALALAALSAAFWGGAVFTGVARRTYSTRRRRYLTASALLAFCPLTVLVIASANRGMHHHVRYVMPVVPYLYLLGSGLLVRRGPGKQTRRVGAGLCGATVVVSSLLTFPHSLSYFNELVGGPAGGLRHLNNSNIDWGQDLLFLAQWQQRRPPAETLHLAYFGRVNPHYAGIRYDLPPLLPERASAAEKLRAARELQPGWYAVSATLLQGRRYMVPAPDGTLVSSPESAFAYFQHLPPAGSAGYSIYLYYVPPTAKDQRAEP